MGFVLYYSNYCVQSQSLLKTLANTPDTKERVYFISVDDRVTDPISGKTFVKLRNGEKIILPPNIIRVPSLIVAHRGNRVYVGIHEIQQVLFSDNTSGDPTTMKGKNTNVPTSDNVVPITDRVMLGAPPNHPGDLVNHEFGVPLDGVVSDKFSFLNAPILSQLKPLIDTPPEEYSKSKLGENVTIESLIAKRNADVPLTRRV
jgi:hypothetical protein